MTNESDVRTALHTVQEPVLKKNIVELGMVRDLEVSEGTVSLTLFIPPIERSNCIKC